MSYRNKKNTNPLENASDLLFVVESEWPKISQKNFNPLDTVLPLLDNTSVGLAHKYSNFVQLNDQITNVLNNCIDGNQRQFIEHLTYYSEVSNTFNKSFELVEDISKDLAKTNDSIISDNKRYLKDLNHSSMVYGKLLDTIEAIEFVKSATEELNKTIGDKNFVKSQELLNQSFKFAEIYQLWKLPLLQSIKTQLEDQETNLFEVIVEELHSMIYLKMNFNKNLLKFSGTNQLSDISSKCTMINKDVLQFVSKLSDLENDDDDVGNGDDNAILELETLLSSDDDGGNFNKLKNLLIILQKMNKFDKLLDILISRESGELSQLFNQTVEDIKVRSTTSVNTKNYWQDNSNELFLLEFGPSPQESAKLKEFFSNIFNKSLVVLQYHRIIYEILSKFKKDYSIERIFDIMEISLRSIITQYIYDEDIISPKNNNTSNNNSSSNNNNSSKSNVKRKQAKLFEFKDFKNDEMTRLASQLQEFFPSFNVDEKVYLDSKELSTQLEVIVDPDIFNMRIILEPFLVFVEGSKMLIPMSKKLSKGSDLFFLEFMRNDFLKNFNFTLQYYYELFCTSNDSFDILIHNNGISKNCDSFQKFLYSILEMLNTSLSFKEEYVNSVFVLLNSFSNRLQLLYQEISDEEDYSWLHNKQLTDISLSIMKQKNGDDNEDKTIESLSAREIELIFNSLDLGNEVTKFEIFFEKCSQLLSSVQWLMGWLPNLIRIDEELQTGGHHQKLTKIDNFKKNWELIDINYSHNHHGKKIFFTLDVKNTARFNKLISGFKSMEDNIMLILRYNLIYRCIYLVLRFFNTNEFYLLNEINEPDSNILKLTTVFLNSNKIFQKNLKSQSSTIVLGLSNLLDHLFIHGSFNIKKLNENGLKKILLNILILQQLLRNLFNLEIKFLKSLQYFDMFKINDKGLIDQISKKKNNFTFEENKNMIRLIYSEDLKGIKRYNDSVLKLQQLYN